jgi:L-alanine-DL-glutamate epimerase-like enolase superfamily enzyme
MSASQTFFSLSYRKIHLPLKYDWALSRNSVSSKTNFIIEVIHQAKKGLGEVAPNIRYNETPEKTEAELASLLKKTYSNPAELLGQITLQSLRCGVESALINASALPFEFGFPNAGMAFDTAYTVPVMEPSRIGEFYKEQELDRFKTIKLKIKGNGGTEALAQLARIHAGTIWLDANEAFTSSFHFLEQFPSLQNSRVELVEQPFPKDNPQAYLDLKGKLSCLLVGDESLGSVEDITQYGHLFDVINIKIQKAGGLIPALECVQTARARGLKVMLGCMVETSIGIRESLKLAPLADYIDQDSFLYLKDEPFGVLTESSGRIIIQ